MHRGIEVSVRHPVISLSILTYIVRKHFLMSFVILHMLQKYGSCPKIKQNRKVKFGYSKQGKTML